MQLGRLDVIAADGGQAERGEHARPVGHEQLVQSPAHPVVVQAGRLPGKEPQQVGRMPLRPGRDAIQRLAGDRQVAHEHSDDPGGLDDTARVGLRQVAGEKFGETQPVKNTVHYREGPDRHVVHFDAGRLHEHRRPVMAPTRSHGREYVTLAP